MIVEVVSTKVRGTSRRGTQGRWWVVEGTIRTSAFVEVDHGALWIGDLAIEVHAARALASVPRRARVTAVPARTR